ncbi:helix-turn-helix domain-containing protein [Chryseobacterium lathyri]|uniref:helix-turn-helix domain-containing protein n=1 Tax=Chryseobacterium lathyri TaxID=395933 RepID=UPI002784156A|nr:helix-turn-helix domain-containing protein [Chryseobacterium lathyri]MDQ0067204.1 AraC-like DNA-binding protein [Chryseobacterium lathyri]
MKTFPKEKILKDDKLIFAKWKTNIVSTKQLILMQENAFVIVTKGKKILFYDEKILEVNNNQILLLKKGVYTMTEYLAEDGFFEAIVIYFNKALIKQANLLELNSIHQAHRLLPDMLILDKSRIMDSFVTQYFSYIKENENTRALLELKVVELIYLIIKRHPNSKDFFNSIGQQSSDLLDLMEKVYKENYTIDQLARLSNRSLSVFKREFNSIFGSSPARWIRTRRLSDARVLLPHTDKSISEIAFACGFNTLSQFDKSFRKHFHKTPSSMRTETTGQIDKT